jgi:hypothetical protein
MLGNGDQIKQETSPFESTSSFRLYLILVPDHSRIGHRFRQLFIGVVGYIVLNCAVNGDDQTPAGEWPPGPTRGPQPATESKIVQYQCSREKVMGQVEKG